MQNRMQYPSALRTDSDGESPGRQSAEYGSGGAHERNAAKEARTNVPDRTVTADGAVIGAGWSPYIGSVAINGIVDRTRGMRASAPGFERDVGARRMCNPLGADVAQRWLRRHEDSCVWSRWGRNPAAASTSSTAIMPNLGGRFYPPSRPTLHAESGDYGRPFSRMRMSASSSATT